MLDLVLETEAPPLPKVAVVGSRTFRDRTWLHHVLDALRSESGDFIVVSGGAKGADDFAQQWADARGLEYIVYLPEWEKHGRKAGMLRNTDIVAESDRLVAFWCGHSKGSKDSIDKARKKGIPLTVHRFDAALHERLFTPDGEPRPHTASAAPVN